MNKSKFLLGGVLALSLFATACSSGSSVLTKPSDAAISFWIDDEVSDSEKAKMTYISNCLGGIGEYLDSAYSATKDGDDYVLPKVHVSYMLTKKDDLTKEGNVVTAISISDPSITVYGLSMSSTEDEVTAKMESLSFTLDCQECTGSARIWSKGNCSIYFGTNGIGVAKS